MALNNFISSLKNMWIGTENDYNDIVVPAIVTGTGLSFDISNADKVSTVYTCVKILAETLSRMPLNIYNDGGEGRTVNKDDYRYPILHYQPNNWTSQQTFFSSLEYWRNIKGNSFARIYRDNAGKLVSLVLIPPSRIMSYSITNDQLYYTVKNDKDEAEIINSSEILHFKGMTKDGIWGINPIEAIRQNISSSYSGIQAIDSFYKNNAMSPKALKSTVSGANQKAMIEALDEFNRKYVGASKAGTMATLPPNTEIIDLALNFADAEFINTMKFNTTAIGALYGVPAWMLGILEQTKFASVETTARDFKNTTLAAIGRMYRQELESKLLTIEERLSGTSIEFNWEALIELDSKTRIENLRALQGMGVVTPNQICKLEGFPTYASGDTYTMPGNYLPVDEIASKRDAISLIRNEKNIDIILDLEEEDRGSESSGNFDHSGRPGEVGGSGPHGVTGATSASDFISRIKGKGYGIKKSKSFISKEPLIKLFESTISGGTKSTLYGHNQGAYVEIPGGGSSYQNPISDFVKAGHIKIIK